MSDSAVNKFLTTPDVPVDPEALAALERFVTESDDLLAIEERIGRFNVFDALGIAKVEIRHSDFLVWLLDPSESHGQGDLFLKSLLMDVLRRVPNGSGRLSPARLDGLQLGEVELRREWNHIDLCVICDEPALVVAIENKIGSGEHSDQLARYKSVVRQHFPRHTAVFLFLTTDGTPPTDDAWTSYTYSDVHRVLSRARRIAGNSLGADVGVFVDHYLTLIGSRFMNDPNIVELCKRIYRTHRAAIDLIVEHAGVGGPGLLLPVAEAIVESAKKPYVFDHQTGRWLRFAPQEWLDLTPPIGRASAEQRSVVFFEIFVDAGRYVRVMVLVGPCTDAERRSRLIERLTRNEGEFGLRVKRKAGPSGEWTRLASETAYRWDEEEEPDQEAATKAILEAFERIRDRLVGVPEVLREVFGKPPS